jgi:SAM-dependent methyltransferase
MSLSSGLARSAGICRELLGHPGTRDLKLDDPRTTERRRDIIQQNRFLNLIYQEWYSLLSSRIPPGSGRVLELGSGAGFFARYVPELITSEVFLCSGIQAVLDARQMPLCSSSLKAIVMVDVFHHIPDIRPFLHEAVRCLRSGGALLMIEPWVSRWSRLIYTHLHHEPFHPESASWSFPPTGPLSGANGALPWIVFERDKQILSRDFSSLTIRDVRPIMPFRYLVSGGVSMRQLMPRALFPIWRQIDHCLSHWSNVWPMFVLIDVRRL